MTFRIIHTTRYGYNESVTLCHNEARLHPRSGLRQHCATHFVRIEPTPAHRQERLDYFGNPVLYFALQEPHEGLRVTADSIVQIIETPLPDLAASPPWENVRAWLTETFTDAAIEARELTLDSPLVPSGPDLALYAAPSFAPGRPLLDAVYDLNRRIHSEFVYDTHLTTVSTPVSDALNLRHGVCQDFAHVAIGCIRAMGLPARYVSGYVESVPADGQPRLRGADASHAWFAVFVPDLGWIDFDPTNDTIVTTQHVTTAWGRDYADVAPLKGVVFGGGSHTLEVEVDVMRESL